VLQSELEQQRESLWQSSSAALHDFKRRIEARAEVGEAGDSRGGLQHTSLSLSAAVSFSAAAA
jgi:hypothetical protein